MSASVETRCKILDEEVPTIQAVLEHFDSKLDS